MNQDQQSNGSANVEDVQVQFENNKPNNYAINADMDGIFDQDGNDEPEMIGKAQKFEITGGEMKESQLKKSNIESNYNVPFEEIDDKYSSNFATAYQKNEVEVEEGEEGKEEELVLGKQIADKLLKDHEKNFQKKFAFEKGAFHQCIPHPSNDNEFITVQLVNRKLDRASEGSVMDQFQDANRSLQYDEYKIVTPQEAEDFELDQGEGEDERNEGEGSDNEQENEMEQARKSTNTKANRQGDLYSDLMEVVDPIEGIEQQEYARLKYEYRPECVLEKDFAVIGFWNLSKNQVFRCYNYFIVQEPMMREIMNVQKTDLQQVLFTGKSGDSSKPDDIFFFYQRNDGDQAQPNLQLMHAILRLDVKEQTKSRLVEENCDVTEISQGSILEMYITKLNKQVIGCDEKHPEKSQVQQPSVTMVDFPVDSDQDSRGKHVVFTAYLRQKFTSQEKDDTGHRNTTMDSHYPTIFFYDIDLNKVTWEIQGGEIFLEAFQYNPRKAPEIYYLTNEIWFEQTKEQITESMKEEDWTRFEEWPSFVNVVKHGKVPPIWDDAKKQAETRKIQAPNVHIKKSYQLSFGQSKNFGIANDHQVVEAFMHNDRKRVTVLYRGRGAFTFAMHIQKPLKDKTAKWFAEFDEKRVECELYFETQKTQNEVKGFRIKGKGVDGGKEFTVKSNLVDIDQEFYSNWTDAVIEMDGEESHTKFNELTVNKAEKTIIGSGVDNYNGNFFISGSFTTSCSKQNEFTFTVNYENRETYGKSTFEGKLNLFRGFMDGKYSTINSDGEEIESGFFQMIRPSDLYANIKVKYTGGDDKVVKENQVKIDFKKMELKHRDGDYEMDFYSIENNDNAQLKYFIKEGDALFIRNGEKAYVQARITSYRDKDDNQDDGYVETSLRLYDVSEIKETKKVAEPSKQTIKFDMNQSYLQTREKVGQLCSPMPIKINENGDIIGSLLYEEYGTDEFQLEFFTTTIGKDEKFDFPQRPLAQTWIVDYPLLAYKSFTPDNKEICVIHMAQNTPQKIISLGEWEFVAFVNHTQMVEHKVFKEEKETNCDIMFLAERLGKIRLMSFKSNPWLHKGEKKKNKFDEQIYKESLFLFSGELAQPQAGCQRSGASKVLENLMTKVQIISKEQLDFNRRYDSDKIQNVQLITQVNGNLNSFMFIIQYNDSITTASLNSKTAFKELCGAHEMTRRHLIRGYNEKVFYAASSGNSEKIFKVEMHPSKPDAVKHPQEVFQLSGSLIAAIESDYGNVQDDTSIKQGEVVNEKLYILDDQAKIFWLEDDDGIKFKIKKVIDFTRHGKLKEVNQLRNNDWAHVHITKRALTFGGDTYNLNTENYGPLTIPTNFYGSNSACASAPEEDEEGEKSGDESEEEDDLESWHVQTVQGMSLTTNLIAVGQKDHKEYCFVVKPAPGNRKLSIMGFQQFREATEMIFVSNQHILVRFRGGKSVILQPNGTAVRQQDRVQDLLDSKDVEIVGESALEFGYKYLALYNKAKDMKNLYILRFERNGRATLITKFLKLKERIKEAIKKDQQIQQLFEGVKFDFARAMAGIQDSDDDKDNSKAKENATSSLKFYDSHLITSNPNEIIKIGAIVIGETKDDEQPDQDDTRAARAQEESYKELVKKEDKKVKRTVKYRVYTDSESEDPDQKFKSLNESAANNESIPVKVIVFICKTFEQRDALLKKTKFQIVGPYLVQKNQDGKKIWLTKLDRDENSLITVTPEADKLIVGESLSIDLKEFYTKKKDREYVLFEPVSRSSHLLIKQHISSKGERKMEYHDNLLQVVVRNFAVIYDLDKKYKEADPAFSGNLIESEIGFLSNIDQFIDPQTYINTGYTHTVARDEYSGDLEWMTVPIIKTNEFNTLCFAQHKTFKKSEEAKDEKDQGTENEGLIFTTYTELDLYELQWINLQLKEKLGKIVEIDPYTILSTFEGHTIFSIYFDNILVYEQIHDQLYEKEFEDEECDYSKDLESSYIRGLMQILKLPTADLGRKPKKNAEDEDLMAKTFGCFTKLKQCCDVVVDKDKGRKGFKSILQKSVHFSHNARYRDVLMQIAAKCSENTIGNFVSNIHDLEILFEQLSPAVLQFFEEGFLETYYTECVKNADWLPNSTLEVFEEGSAIMNEDKANSNLQDVRRATGKKGVVQSRQVTMKMLSVRWLFTNGYDGKKGTRGVLVKALAYAPIESLFSTDLVITLVQSFWSKFQSAMIWRCFIPFLAYFSSVLIYFIHYLPQPITDENEWAKNELICRIGFFILWIYFLIHEIVQIFLERSEYIADFWNFFDVSSIILNFYLICSHVYPGDNPLDQEWKFSLASIATFIMWLKVFYWFRLFNATSFYIRLITETVQDISTFMIILVAFLFMFANCIYVLNLYRKETDLEDSELFGNFFEGHSWLNSILNQYLLALGEFNMDAFSENQAGDKLPNSPLVWALFIGATFITQITILNMLIAIMGDTFGKVSEMKEQSALREKINILADFVWIIKMKDQDAAFIYAMKPKTLSNEGESWEGTVTTLKKTINSAMADQKANFSKKISGVETEVKLAVSANKILEEKVGGLQSSSAKQLTILLDIQKKINQMETSPVTAPQPNNPIEPKHGDEEHEHEHEHVHDE